MSFGLTNEFSLTRVRERIAKVEAGDVSLVPRLVRDLRHFLSRDHDQRDQLWSYRSALVEIERLGGKAGQIAKAATSKHTKEQAVGGPVRKGHEARSIDGGR